MKRIEVPVGTDHCTKGGLLASRLRVHSKLLYNFVTSGGNDGLSHLSS